MNLQILMTAEEGKTFVLRKIEGGMHLRKRLNAMGLNEGMKIKVMHNQHHGGCVVLVGKTRLVLGRGMSHKIFVEEVLS